MESKFHIIEEIVFQPSSLMIKLSSLLPGEPDGNIGLPLTITDNSSHYLVLFEEVGRFRVINETFNEFNEPYEEITKFLYKMIDSVYLEKYKDTAKCCAYKVSRDAEIMHYVIYSERYVVDILCGKSPTWQEITG